MVEGITGVFTGSFLKHSWNGQSISVYDENGKMDIKLSTKYYCIIMMVQCQIIHLILLIITLRLFWRICAS